MICRDLRALSLDIIVEMKFQLAGNICGATLVNLLHKFTMYRVFDSQKHASIFWYHNRNHAEQKPLLFPAIVRPRPQEKFRWSIASRRHCFIRLPRPLSFVHPLQLLLILPPCVVDVCSSWPHRRQFRRSLHHLSLLLRQPPSHAVLGSYCPAVDR